MADIREKIAQFQVKGLISAPLTPMTADWEVNYDLVPKCAQKIADGGLTGVFINGTMGEGPAMIVQERKLVTEAWVKAGEGRLKYIVAQVGAGNMHESIDLAKHAEKAGVSAIACLCPTYYKPTTAESLVLYMKQVAAAAPNTPFYLYEINQFTHCPVSVDKFFALAKDKIPTLRGMKYSNLHPPPGYCVAQLEGGRYQVMAGSDEQYLSYLSMGLDVNVVSSHVGFLAVRLEKAFKAGDIKVARQEQAKLQTMRNLLNGRNGFDLSVVKAVASEAMGIEMGPARPPWVPTTLEARNDIAKKLRETGYFDWLKQ